MLNSLVVLFSIIYLVGKDDVVAIITPKQSVEEKVAVATLERQKSQVDKLESELESVSNAILWL